jgi:transposase
MKKRKTSVIQKVKKRMGRPPTVHGEHLVAMRLSTEMLSEVDRWAKDNKSSRSDAIRELIERGLRPR